MITNTDVNTKTTFRLLMAYAALLATFYVSVFDVNLLHVTSMEHFQMYFVISVVTFTFLLDIVWLKCITRGLSEKLQGSINTTDTLDLHFKKAIALPGLYPVIRQEILVVFYAFFARHFSPPVDENNQSFSYHKAGNAHDVFWLVAVAQLPGLPFIHFFIEHQGNSLAAWFVTLITLWSVVYFYAQKYAVQFCPITIRDTQLHYKFGMSWHASIPIGNIKSARLPGFDDQPDYFEYFTSPFGSDKNLLLEFKEPVLFKGLYLNQKRRQKAIIAVDDPGALLTALKKVTNQN